MKLVKDGTEVPLTAPRRLVRRRHLCPLPPPRRLTPFASPLRPQRFAIGTTCYGAGIIGLSLFALVFSLLHVKHLIGFCNFLVWWLHVIGWVLTGLCFIIYVFSSDMCAAKAYIDKNGGVRSIIPCVSPTDGMKALNVTYGTMYFVRSPPPSPRSAPRSSRSLPPCG